MNTVKLLKLAGALAVALTAAAPTASLAYPAAPHQIQVNERVAMDDHDRMPPDRFERIPPMPHRGFVWHKGHWRFDRGAWIWVSGVWLAR